MCSKLFERERADREKGWGGVRDNTDIQMACLFGKYLSNQFIIKHQYS